MPFFCVLRELGIGIIAYSPLGQGFFGSAVQEPRWLRTWLTMTCERFLLITLAFPFQHWIKLALCVSSMSQHNHSFTVTAQNFTPFVTCGSKLKKLITLESESEATPPLEHVRRPRLAAMHDGIRLRKIVRTNVWQVDP